MESELDLGSTEFWQGTEAMRARLQHYLNSMHVYCRLVRYVIKARARRLAQSWEAAWLHRNLVYAAKQEESEHVYGESIGFDESTVPVYLWDVTNNEIHNQL
jgi:hypothetical protein